MLKQDILIKNGTYNKNFTKVTEQRFINDDFYDARDLVQVKYEMLRTVRDSDRCINEVVEKFGFSRSGFYKIKDAFEKEGVSAFVPSKTGPQNARKLTKEHQQFIDHYLMDNPDTSSDDYSAVNAAVTSRKNKPIQPGRCGKDLVILIANLIGGVTDG